ncbi:MAG: cyclase family protein [Alphaproteobacteria bacterium]|nr:cyclase family protein [Alphaproteobacteria bacterium]
MARRTVNLGLEIEDNMPSHKYSQSPVYPQSMTHESAKAMGLGTLDDQITFQTNFSSTLDHVGTHVDGLYRHFNPKGATINQMPLDLFMGKAVCLDMRHVHDLGDIDVADLERSERKAVVKADGHIVLMCTGLHRRHYPNPEVCVSNPGLTAEATHWLHARGSRLHGVEGPSTDKPSDKLFAQHRTCRDLGITHMEWLVNLEELLGLGEFQFFGMPIKFKGGSGSPIRAFAILDS